MSTPFSPHVERLVDTGKVSYKLPILLRIARDILSNTSVGVRCEYYFSITKRYYRVQKYFVPITFRAKILIYYYK